MKRNHPGKNKTERPRMERGKGGGEVQRVYHGETEDRKRPD